MSILWPAPGAKERTFGSSGFPADGRLISASAVSPLRERGDRIAIPFVTKKQLLERIDEDHMGMTTCRERAAQSVWWPQVGKEIKSRVASSRDFLERQPSKASEPLLPSSPLPERACQKEGLDICEFRNKHYVVQTDS